MSIRLKITVFVLLGTLTEAMLLGGIGYHSVNALSGSAQEFRQIGLALRRTQELNLAVAGLGHPGYLREGGSVLARRRFLDDMDNLQRQVATCAAVTCHGINKRPPVLAGELQDVLTGLRRDGLALLAGGPANAHEAWMEMVDGPAHQVAEVTQAMSSALVDKARALDIEAVERDRTALVFVAVMTLICVLMAVALSHPIAAGIARPLENLAHRIELVASGKLNEKVAESGPAETALLARSFNRMTENLARSREDLEEHHALLERRIQNGIQSLRQKDEELHRQERLATMGLVAGSVAHDLNNPLSSMLMNAELALESTPPTDENRALLESVVADARRCRNIAAEIRSALGRAQVPMTPGELSQIAEVAAEAIRLLQFKWEPRDISVVCDAPAGDALCVYNRPRLLQLWINLIDNAMDATADGGQVDVRVLAQGDDIILEVEDRGPGIRRKDRDSLFRPFFTTKASGGGLGLSICRRIVDQHHGRFEVESWTEADLAAGSERGHPGTVVRTVLPRYHHEDGDE